MIRMLEPGEGPVNRIPFLVELDNTDVRGIINDNNEGG